MARAQKRSKEKGYEGEVEVVQRLRRYFPDAERTGSATGFSAPGAADIRNVYGYHVQVKRRNRTAIGTLFREVQRATKDSDRIPLLLIRDDYGEWLAVHLLEDWIEDQFYKGEAP